MSGIPSESHSLRPLNQNLSGILELVQDRGGAGRGGAGRGGAGCGGAGRVGSGRGGCGRGSAGHKD